MTMHPERLRSAVEDGRFGGQFSERLDRISGSHGIGIRLDRSALDRAVARWRPLQAERVPGEDRGLQARAIVEAHGRMTRELVAEPELLQIALRPDSNPVAEAAAGWPAGFCIYLAMMALCRDALGEEEAALSPTILDARTWWSIRETVAEDSASARPFLAYVLGIRPAWHDRAFDLHA